MKRSTIGVPIFIALVVTMRPAWACVIAAVDASSDVAGRAFVFPSASEPFRQGFVRVVNHSAWTGDVQIHAVDDAGRRFDPVTLEIDANETVHFNSEDLEAGNPDKGLPVGTGAGEGDWRLDFSSNLDIEVHAYIRTSDGFLTGMNAIAPMEEDGGRVAIFNPGSNRNQISILRLVNLGSEEAAVTINATDDAGSPGLNEIVLTIDAGAAMEITAAELESGTAGFEGMLGDGSGKWRLLVGTEQPVVAMSLMESPEGHLTNLSGVPMRPGDGVHRVPFFPAAGDASGRQGFVRIVNRSPDAGEVRIRAYDETDRDHGSLTLPIGANEVEHFNSDHLERAAGACQQASARLSATVPQWDPLLVEDHFVETTVGNVEGVETAVVDAVGFEPGEHGQRITDTFLGNTDHAALVQIDGWGNYQHHGMRLQSINHEGYTRHALRSEGVFWTSTDANYLYSPGRSDWFIVDGRPYVTVAKTFARWARHQNVLFVGALENPTGEPNDAGGRDPVYCDDFDSSADEWLPLCDFGADYIAHSGTGVDKVLFAGAINRSDVARAAIRANGVFAPHTIYVESPDGSTSHATPVLAAYATNLSFANPKWGAARLKRELMDLAREETLDHVTGAATPSAASVTEERTVKVIRPDFAPSAVP